MNKLIYLAKNYDLVVGDRFELFYRGVIASLNPYKYYIYVNCIKGRNYPRYYTFTPNESDIGDYDLLLQLYDDYHNLIEEAHTTLHVHKAASPKKMINILCWGDSLTFNGVWPYEGYRRFTGEKIDPLCYGLNNINLIGTMKYNGIGYEGYGGWKWKEFCGNDVTTSKSDVWVKCNHHLDENDQESIWETNGFKWILESIEEGRVKFKHGPGNWTIGKNIGPIFKNVDGGVHKEDIVVDSFEFTEGNPFYNPALDGPSFKYYCEKNNFDGLDYVYVLLSWNGLYVPYDTKFETHDKYARFLISKIHEEYPNCKVRVMGVQSPAINGGITASYGCNGYYHDLQGDLFTAYNYCEYLENLCNEEGFKSYCRYIDMKAQFDVENNTPMMEVKVNNRCERTELIGTNGVHPLMSGYLQFGDAFFRALVADMNNELGE